MGKDINRIKVVLVEKKKINKWLFEQIGCIPPQYQKGVQIPINHQ